MIGRGRSAVVCLVGGAIAGAVACSLSGTDGLSGGPVGDASPGTSVAGETGPPGPPPDDGGTDDAPASGGPVNLLANGDFELGCSGGWGSPDAFLKIAESTAAHGGARSCRLCSEAFDAGSERRGSTVLSEASISWVRRMIQTGLPRHSMTSKDPGASWLTSTSTGAPAARARSEGHMLATKGTAAATPAAPPATEVATTSLRRFLFTFISSFMEMALFS